MNIKELLAYSLDNELSETAQERLKRALADSDELRQLRDELFAMRSLLEGHLPERKADFTTAILKQVPLRLALSTQVLYLFPRVAAACIALMLMTYAGIDLGNTDWVSDVVVGIQEISPEEAYAYLNDGGALSEFLTD